MSTNAGGTTAEEAAAKAKEIAARLMSNAVTGLAGPVATSSGTATNTVSPSASSSGTSERKRKRWGMAPPESSTTSNPILDTLPGLAEAARKKQLSEKKPQEPANKRIWVPTSAEKPETHFKSYLKERLSELCARINNSGNFNGDEKNRIELGGRGASDKPPLPGMPLEPMHVMIYGSSEEFVEAAAPQVEELLAEGERADREGPPPEAGGYLLEGSSSTTSTTDYSSALTLSRPYRSDTLANNANRQSEYKPATVAQLISNNPNVLNPTLGVAPEELMEEIINVPNGVVGFLIGRGGETISSMQARSGCKVQIQKEHDLKPGQTHRVITLQATTQESIDQCRGMIESMVQDRIRAAGGSANGGSHNRDDLRGSSNSNINSVDVKVSEALAVGHVLVKVDVPDADVGLIIGKAGTTIKSIQDATGSAIQIPQAGNADNPSVRTISITCPTMEGAQAAKSRIEDVLKAKPTYAGRGIIGGDDSTSTTDNSRVPQSTIQVMIPDKDVGLCIGRQGCVIREMQSKTSTRIQIPTHPTPGHMYRVATVTGTQEGCDQARALIERIVTEQSSACVMSGYPHHNSNNGRYHQQGGYNDRQSSSAVQNAAQNSDPAWQAYYAAQAVAKQQQEQQQQKKQKIHTDAAALAPDAYYEQFFRYAYYYGEEAARQYYGSWSPPVGTPNPYGVNPNPSSAPAADGGGLSAASSVQASQGPAQINAGDSSGPSPHTKNTAVRDSSVRKVSNLPAWMTKS